MGWLDRRRRAKEERSSGGIPIHRHQRAARPRRSGGDPELIEAIAAHIETHVGEPETVFHQLVSSYVHVDIHIVPASEERPWITLVTSGMSERAMKGPRELGAEVSRAELVMALPPDWPLGEEASSDERNYWPFRLLQMLATLPHEFNTWLWMGHTVPNGDPPAPYAENTDLCGVLLFPPLLSGDEFVQMHHGDHVVTFLAVIPLHADEMQLKLEHSNGPDELADRLDAAHVTELLDPARPSVA